MRNNQSSTCGDYANWEELYNECVRTYMRFLIEKGGKVRDSDWLLLVSAFHSDFESMRDRSHSLESRQKFVENLKTKIDCMYDAIDTTIVEARSNLDFSRLSQNYALLSFDLSAMQRARNRLGKELVGWRHAVAHGDSPDLTTMDVEAHIDFASSLLFMIADRFQHAMLGDCIFYKPKADGYIPIKTIGVHDVRSFRPLHARRSRR